MHQAVSPPGIAPPAANYAHARLATDAQRWLHTSGVVGVRPDGTVPADFAEQVDVVWDNLTAILEEAGMAPDDIVSVTTYVVQGNDLATVMAARDRVLGGHLAASTLVILPELARPEWQMEVALVAASAP